MGDWVWDKIMPFKYITSSQSQVWKILSTNLRIQNQHPFQTTPLFQNLNG